MKKVVLSLLFFLPIFTSAQVVITEIMYDLGPEPASDTDREWIEIFNSGQDAVNLTDWRFVESGSPHKFLPYPEPGDVILEPNAYAVVVIKPDVFLADWPAFSGKIFDSSFSLKNSEGETLSIRDSSGVDVDVITYDPALGGNGDGNSLQKTSSVWASAAPTPGAANAFALENDSDNSGNDNNENTDNNGNNNDDGSSGEAPGGEAHMEQSTTSGTMPLPPNIKAYIKNRETIVGASVPVAFTGYGIGLEDEPLINGRYVWNFGDGVVSEGENVLHTYMYPGEYIVVLDVSSGRYAASARLSIKAVPVEVVIGEVGADDDFYVKLENKSLYHIDLGGWLLSSGGSYFRIPPKTFIQKGGTLMFSPLATKLSFADKATLYSPLGKEAFVFLHHTSASPHITDIVIETTTSVSPKNLLARAGTSVPSASPQLPPEEETASNTASLGKSFSGGENQPLVFSSWFFMLVALIVVGISGFFLVRRGPSSDIAPEEKLAYEIEITEEKEAEETKER